MGPDVRAEIRLTPSREPALDAAIGLIDGLLAREPRALRPYKIPSERKYPVSRSERHGRVMAINPTDASVGLTGGDCPATPRAYIIIAEAASPLSRLFLGGIEFSRNIKDRKLRSAVPRNQYSKEWDLLLKISICRISFGLSVEQRELITEQDVQ